MAISLSNEMKLIAALRRMTGVTSKTLDPESVEHGQLGFQVRKEKVRSLIVNTGCGSRLINPEDKHSPTYASAFEQSYGESL